MKPGAALDYGPALAALLDRIDAAQEALKDTVKERRGEIAKMQKQARRLRDLIAGRAADQLEVPGTSEAADALAAARGGRS